MHTCRLLVAFAAGLILGTAGCSSETTDDAAEGSDDALRRKADEHWFYSGPLDPLADPEVTISLAGHTARVRGFLPAGADVASLPHARVQPEGDRQRVDLVYPIATAAPGSDNARPGTYAFFRAVLFRPDGNATSSSGTSFVTWGGFPFLAYNGGIAMHGPISFEDNRTSPDFDVFYLKRGTVSHGCNRMLGEHVTELAHALGMTMRRVYDGNRNYTPPAGISVRVIQDYDRLDGKHIDVDYPTNVGVRRPAKVHGADAVTMFGSWVATEMPNGEDLPREKQWEGGVSGQPYRFDAHARASWVCSIPRPLLLRLRAWEKTLPGDELPRSFCEKKACVVDRLQANESPAGCF
jgi:hypothetical protein